MLRIAIGFAICFWSAFANAREITDPDQFAEALWLEALRANPTLAQDENIIAQAQRRFPELNLPENTTAGTVARIARPAAAWLASRAAEPSRLPLEATVALGVLYPS